MVAANFFMDLLQNIFGFLLINALQVRHGEASFVQGVIQDREPCYPFSDLPGVFDILWKSSILKEGQDWGHPATFALDYEGEDLFDARMFLDFNLQVCIRWSCF